MKVTLIRFFALLLAGILLIALGIVQYMLKLQEKYHQIQLELGKHQVPGT